MLMKLLNKSKQATIEMDSTRYCAEDKDKPLYEIDQRAHPAQHYDGVLKGKRWQFHHRREGPMKIKNINGTTDNTCKCSSWFKHWEVFSGQTTDYCQANSCLGKELVGAHVQKAGASTDLSWYIYPLCKEHNKHKGELEVSDAYRLVSANVKETCGK